MSQEAAAISSATDPGDTQVAPERAPAGEAQLATARPRSARYALLLAAISAVWGVLMSQFGQGQIYWIMGPYAATISVVLLTVRGRALLALLRPNPKNVALGCAVGVGMTLATYPAFSAARALFPELLANVAQLYRQSHEEWLPTAVAFTVVILVAEELLWRGAWLEALTPRLGRRWAGFASVVIYAGTQLCCKSFIVGLLALCCGAVWTVQRRYSNSLVAPLISHAIWTPTVILLVPVV